MSGDPATRARENATAIASMIVTGLWLALLLSGLGGGSLWLAVLLVGYLVVVPLVALLYGDEEDRAEWWDGVWGDADWDDWGEWWGEESEELPEERDLEPSRRDALETLRERYAAGDLTDEQFEHKLERLLEVETIEDADEWARGRSGDRRAGDREFERER